MVLPFVPVTRIHSAAFTLSRTRQASSMSPHTATPAASGPLEHRVVGVEAGRRDDELGCERDELVGHGVERMPQQARPDHLEDARPVVVDRGREHEHVGAELGERVGDGEPGDAEAEHRDAEAAPVGVPAREGREARGDGRGIRFGQLCSHSK